MDAYLETPRFGVKRIAVRGVNWLGDAVMTTPALLRLREAYPSASITLVTAGKLADLWPGHPAVDEVLPFHSGESAWSVSRRLRSGQFELGVLLPNSFRAALEFWWARIPHRIGYAGQLRSWLLTQGLPSPPGRMRMRKRTRHEVLGLNGLGVRERPAAPRGEPFASGRDCRESPSISAASHHVHDYLHLVSHLGANPAPLSPRLMVSDSEVETALRRLRVPLPGNRLLLGLNPGAEYGPAKRWPADRFVAAAHQVQQRLQCCWLVLGGKGDRELAAEVSAGIKDLARKRGCSPNEGGVFNLAGETSLRELCAVLKSCRVLLTNDTGPMHAAAALGTPVVALFGSTSPRLTGPGLPGGGGHRLLRSDVPCAPCFLRECPIDFRCMRRIEVNEVVEAVLEAARP